jgi:hypothetical protein
LKWKGESFFFLKREKGKWIGLDKEKKWDESLLSKSKLSIRMKKKKSQQ